MVNIVPHRTVGAPSKPKMQRKMTRPGLSIPAGVVSGVMAATAMQDAVAVSGVDNGGVLRRVLRILFA